MDEWNGKYTRPLDLAHATNAEFMAWLQEQRNDPAQQAYRERIATDPAFAKRLQDEHEARLAYYDAALSRLG
jgi:hypothetical protein